MNISWTYREKINPLVKQRLNEQHKLQVSQCLYAWLQARVRVFLCTYTDMEYFSCHETIHII